MTYRWNPLTGNLDFVGAGSSAPPSSISDSVFVEIITLNNTQVTDKEITLAQTPTDASKVVLDIISGTSQVVGSDFSVTGNVLTWNGLALETILEENDIVRVQYYV